jgi:O-antigen ligase
VKEVLSPLLFFQRFFLPALWLLVLWAIWRTIVKKDAAIGLAFYLGIVIVVDGFLNTAIYLPGLATGSIRYSEVCAGFLFLIPPVATSRTAPFGAVRLLCVVYFGLLALSVLRSDLLFASTFDFRARIVPQIVAVVVAGRGLRSPDFFRRFLLCMMVLCILIGLFVLWDLFFDRWLIQSEQLFKPEYGVSRQHGRFGSFFLNPNYLGAFVVLLFPVVFVATMNERTAWAKALGGVTLLSLAFSLVETQSRGPLVAMSAVVVLLLFGPAGRVSRTQRLGAFSAVAVLFIVLMPGFFTRATGRFDQINDELSGENARTRETIWRYTNRAIADNPVLGIGFGEQHFQRTIMYDYGLLYDYGAESLDNPHNSYLQMTVYAGFPALFAFIAANGLLLLCAFQWVRRSHSEITHIGFGLLVGIAGFLLVIYPDMHMFTPNVAPVYWVFFVLLLSLITQTGNAQPRMNKAYESGDSHVENPVQRLAGQSAAVAPRHRWDRNRAAAARFDTPGEDREAAAHDSPLWPDSRDQQAAVQQSAGWRAIGGPGPYSKTELLSRRRTGRIHPPGTDSDC